MLTEVLDQIPGDLVERPRRARRGGPEPEPPNGGLDRFVDLTPDPILVQELVGWLLASAIIAF